MRRTSYPSARRDRPTAGSDTRLIAVWVALFIAVPAGLVATPSGGASAVPHSAPFRPPAAASTMIRPAASTPAAVGWSTQDTLFVDNGTLRAGNVNATSLSRPWYVAYDPTTGDLYASIDCAMYVVDPSTMQIVSALPASGGCGVIYLASTGYLYESAAGNISVVNPVTDSVVQRIRAPEAGQTVYGLFVYDAAANAIVVGNAFDSICNVVSLSTGRIVANLTLGYNSVDGAYDPVNHNLYVAQYESGAVAVVNSTTWNFTSVSVSSEGLFAYGLAVDDRTGDVYVSTYAYSTGMVRISGSTNAILNETSFGNYLTGVAYDNSSNVVYVADSSQQRVYALNPANLSAEATLSTPAPAFGIEGPWWISYVPELNTLFVPTSYQRSIVAVDAANDSVYATLGGLTEPYATAWDASCGCLVVGDWLNEDLWFINATTFTVARTIHLPGPIRGITYDNTTGQLWVGLGNLIGSSGIEILDGVNGTEVQLLSSGDWSSAPAYDWIDDRMYAPDVQGNKLNVYNATNLTLVQTINDSYVYGATWDPSNDRIFAADWEATNVTVYDGGNGTLVATIPHIPGPSTVAYDPTTDRVYTANQNDQNVSVIDPATDTSVGNLTLSGWAEQLLPQPGTDELVLTTGSDTVEFYDLATNTSVAVPAGQSTGGLAWLGSGALAATDTNGAVYLVSNTTTDLLATPQLTIAPFALAEGSSLTLTTQETGGATPYRYAYAGLPAGCASANASSVTCTPTAGGTYRVATTVTDASGHSASASAEAWVERSYPVTFHADGLPTGVMWWVNLSTGGSYSSTTDTVTFSSVNTTVRYTIGVGAPWVAVGNATGPVSVAGAAVSLTITFAATQPVTFMETGLPAGTSWQVVIGSSRLVGNGTTLTVGELPGNYRYTASVAAGGFGAVSGSVSVGTAPVPVTVPFVLVTYQLAFLAQGLPSGTNWSVRLSTGVVTYTATTELKFSLPNGTVHYVAQTASTEWRALGGNATVQGGGSAVALDFQTQTYAVTFSATGLPASVAFWVNLTGGPTWYGTSPVGGPEPNGSYAYSASAGVGWAPLTGSFAVTGQATVVPLTFVAVFRTVTFTAVGLAASASWSVNFTGTAPTATTAATVSLQLQRGAAVAYEVHGPSDERPLHPSGTVRAATTDQNISVAFPTAIALTGFTATPATIVLGASTQVSASADGGEPPLNFSFAAPNDAGCGTASAGTMTCTPSTTGTFTVALTVSDGVGSYVNGTLTLTATAPTSPAGGGSGGPSVLVYALIAAVIGVAAVGGLLAMRSRRRAPTPADEADAPASPEADPGEAGPTDGAPPGG